ncbi:hypothetical protein JYT20_01115 [Rhodothermus sp. AH-315-K08]|nr:hypothetical protein [Rhodothermus sp. AH-315-K08]
MIRSLFRDGQRKSVSAGAVRILYRVVESSQLPVGVRVQAGVAAPGGVRGVRRNLVRRRLMEAYRQVGHGTLLESVGRLLGSTEALTLVLVDRRRANAAEIDFRRLQSDILEAIQKIETAISDSANESLS